ncbi:DNA repair protein [Planococcus lenghuensis]|uniref:DNA repair protein n=1 Tax=Planococcus lenghuensis TaxID=2213202 RepID=A0A1Q2L500_9BACL|nr:DUF488 domain-containing protein [Planococcus lenghuensis]AQQ55167.1 DNA repair protein [Planococcus lenghuensis]
MILYTIGHSGHSRELFRRMLKEHGIEVLADVRAYPGSRKWPQFSRDQFPEWLEADGFTYRHFPKLGGRRRKSKVIGAEVNAAWRNRSFHNYADYCLTEEFQEGIDELLTLAADKQVAYCCSERHPARCHRLLISNWLTTGGHEVKHIIDGKKETIELVDHELGIWGAPPLVGKGGIITYPVTEPEGGRQA